MLALSSSAAAKPWARFEQDRKPRLPCRLALALHQVEVAGAAGPRLVDDAVGDALATVGCELTHASVTPSRSVSAIAADGPQLPAV